MCFPLQLPQKLLAHHLPPTIPPSRLISILIPCSPILSLFMISLGNLGYILPLPPSCYLFSFQDIREAVWEMNTSKVVDEEGFQAEFFKHDLHTLDSHLADLLNHAVHIGFPSTWSHHIIHSIHKSTPSMDPNNYRTIMVGHAF